MRDVYVQGTDRERERERDRRRGGSGIKSSSSERKTDKAASVLHFRTPRNDLIDW